MKSLLILAVLLLAIFYVFERHKEDITHWVGENLPSSEGTSEDWISIRSVPKTNRGPDGIPAPPKLEDQMFAVMRKLVIENDRYTTKFERNAVGKPVTKVIPEVYFFECLGRETRDTTFFIVEKELYDNTRPREKLGKAVLSGSERFSSEKSLREAIAQRRKSEKESS